MGNSLKKLIIFLVIIFGITLFASDAVKAPNEIIKDNPDREVTTVDSMKVREHATMSLNITKVEPEEIMGSLKNGKLSVFISKKQDGKRKKKDIDVSKLKLQAYSNVKNAIPTTLKANSKNSKGFSAEEIRSMMNSGSKEKKINVVANTDEYVKLEVEDVKENEKIYISVMNGEKIVKSYRIADISPYAPYDYFYCWNPTTYSTATLGTTSSKETINFDEKASFLFYKTDGADTYKVSENDKFSKIIKAGVTPERPVFKLDDEFINYTTDSQWAENGMALKVSSTDIKDPTNDMYDLYNKTKNYDVTGIRYNNVFNKNTADASLNGYLVVESEKKGNQIWFQEISKLIDYSPTGEGGCQKNTTQGNPSMRAKVTDIGRRLWVDSSKIRPGLYQSFETKYTLTKKNTPSTYFEHKATYTLQRQSTTTTTVTKTTQGTVNGPIIISDNTSYNDNSLSFMKKDFNGVNDTRGLYNGNGTKLTPSLKNGSWESSEFDVTSNNGGQAKVKITQKDNEYITVILTPTILNNTSTFEFELTQKGLNNVVLKKVKYNITAEKTNTLGNIVYNIDSRIEGAGGKWINPHGVVKDDNGNITNTLPELVNATDTITDNISNHISDIVNITGRADLKNDTNKKFKALLDGTNEIAFPYGVSSALYNVEKSDTKIVVNKRDLENVTKTPVAEQMNTFILRDSTNTYLSGSITEKYYGSKNPNSGNGTIDLTKATLNTEYTYNPDGTNDSGAPQLTTTTNRLDGRGRLDKNKTKSIITRVEISATTKSGTVEKTINGQVGKKIEPQAVPELEGKIGIGISEGGGLILKRLSNEGLTGATKKVLISYYYKEVKLGEFTLEVTMNSNGPTKDTGTLNIAQGRINEEGGWDFGQEPTNGDSTNGLMLTMDNSGKPFDNVNGQAVDSVEVTVDGKSLKMGKAASQQVDLNGDNTKDIEIKFDATKFYVKKLTNENIESKKITIKAKNNNTVLDILELTVKNPVIKSNREVTVEIDNRFKVRNVEPPNWLFRSGETKKDIQKDDFTTEDYSYFFHYSGELDNLVRGGVITKALDVEERPNKQTELNKKYAKFNVNGYINGEKWKDEAALPNQGPMTNLNNLITVSKGNRDEGKEILDNKFSLAFKDGSEYKVYKGNIKEKYVGVAKPSGRGRVYLVGVEKNKIFKFSTKMARSGFIHSDGDLVITDVSGLPVDSRGLVGPTKGQNIANKIKVEANTTTRERLVAYGVRNNSTLEATEVGGLILGIDTVDGGLTLKKTKDRVTVKSVTIKYSYAPPNTTDEKMEIPLGEFILQIDDPIFEIDGPSIFDFGDMVYKSENLYITHGAFYNVKCNDPAILHGKKVTFSVDSSKVTPMKSKNNGEIPLQNPTVTTYDDSKFYLSATADMSSNPSPGVYKGTIDVVVTVTNN